MVESQEEAGYNQLGLQKFSSVLQALKVGKPSCLASTSKWPA